MSDKSHSSKRELERFQYWAQKEKHLFWHPRWMVHRCEILKEALEHLEGDLRERFTYELLEDYLKAYRTQHKDPWTLQWCGPCYKLWREARGFRQG